LDRRVSSELILKAKKKFLSSRNENSWIFNRNKIKMIEKIIFKYNIEILQISI
jgi:hypothetical protein